MDTNTLMKEIAFSNFVPPTNLCTSYRIALQAMESLGADIFNWRTRFCSRKRWLGCKRYEYGSEAL